MTGVAATEGAARRVAAAVLTNAKLVVAALTFPAGTTAITAKEMEGLYTLFDDLYEKAFGQGSGYREAGKEILTFRLTATGLLKKPDIKAERAQRSDGAQALKGQRGVYFEEERKFVSTRVYDFAKMHPGVEFDGPAIIESAGHDYRRQSQRPRRHGRVFQH